MNKDNVSRVNEKKKSNIVLFFISIPLIIILLLFLINLGSTIYNKNKIDKDVRSIFSDVLNDQNNDSYDDYKERIFKLLEDEGYDTSRTELIEKDNAYILIHYANYYTIFQSVFYGKNTSAGIDDKIDQGLGILNQVVSKEGRTTVVKYKGYFDEYSNVVIEKYSEE